MVDQIYDRGYQDGRAELHDGVDALARKLGKLFATGLSAAHRLQWRAPWDSKFRPNAKA